jgi:hypothetical protein
MRSQTFSGIYNLPLGKNLIIKTSLKHSKRALVPNAPGSGRDLNLVSSYPDAGQSDSVSQIHQVRKFTGVDPDNEKGGENDDEP